MSTILPTDSYANLAATLMKTVDRNADGQVSLNEFSGFLERLLGHSSPTQPASAPSGTTSAGAASAATAPLTSATRTPIDDMAQYGTREKMLNEAHQTLKYRIGRVLQYYPHTPEGLRDALPELQQIVPGVKTSGSKGDKLDFGDYIDARSGHIGVVDVVRAAGAGGTAWQWLPVK